MSGFRIPEGPYTLEGVMETFDREFGEPTPAVVRPGGGHGSATPPGSPSEASSGSNEVSPVPPAEPPLPAPADMIRGMLSHLSSLERSVSVTPEYVIRGHRPLLRLLIDPLKKIVFRLTRPYVELLIAKQERFNLASLEAMREATSRLDHLLKVEEVHRESLRAHDRFVSEQAWRVAEIESSLRAVSDHVRATEEVFREALRRHDAAMSNLAARLGALAEFESSARPALEHARATEGVFREALGRHEAAIADAAGRLGSLAEFESAARPALEHARATEGVFREALARHDAFIEGRQEFDRRLEERLGGALEHARATEEVFREAHARHEAFAETQQAFNAAAAAFESAARPALEHLAATDEIFRETFARLDRFTTDQIGYNAGFERRIEAAAEVANRADATADSHAPRLESLEGFERHQRSLRDLGPFFDALTPEARTAFMDRFRGSFGHLRGLHHIYLPLFQNRPGRVLDLGCGRGEFLEMLRFEGIEAWGCEIDPVMIEICRRHDVVTEPKDALTALRDVEDASLGGIFASQVIEHLYPGELLELLTLSRRKLAPGGVVALESLNPQSMGVLAKSYYKDLDHKQPIDPDYLGRLMELAGFEKVQVRKIRPFEDPEKLPDLPPADRLGLPPEAARALGEIVRRLNDTVWGPQDYYVAGEVPSGRQASDEDASSADFSDAEDAETDPPNGGADSFREPSGRSDVAEDKPTSQGRDVPAKGPSTPSSNPKKSPPARPAPSKSASAKPSATKPSPSKSPPAKPGRKRG